MAESSWTTRRSQWRHYMSFCEQVGAPPLPAKSELLSVYVAFMAKTFKYVSIMNYVSAVRALHKCYGLQCVPPDDMMLSMTLTGARRLLGDSCFSSKPLLPYHLLQMYQTLDMSSIEDLVFWAAVVTAFRGLLRKSAICKGDLCLLRCDVKFYTWGMILSQSKSKTIQFKHRLHEIPISQVGGPLCAFELVKCVCRAIPTAPDLPLFGCLKQNCYRPITYNWFSKKFIVCLKQAGIYNTGCYTSHSLRRGGATALSMIGVPLHEIQWIGDWKSLSDLLYLASPLEYRITKERHLASKMVNIRV